MAGRVEWIAHRGESILLVDCSGAQEAEVLDALDEAERELVTMDKGQKVLMLLDMSDVRPSMALTARGDALIKACDQAGVPEMPTALVGPEGWQKTLTKMYMVFRKDKSLFVADSLEEAKEWLIEQ